MKEKLRLGDLYIKDDTNMPDTGFIWAENNCSKTQDWNGNFIFLPINFQENGFSGWLI